MSNHIIHFEIGCQDREATSRFYGAIFDWKLEDLPGMTTIGTGSEVGGHIASLGHPPHQYTMFYVSVDSIETTLAAVEANGGKKIVGPVDVPGGRFAWISDPEGNVVGLFETPKTS